MTAPKTFVAENVQGSDPWLQMLVERRRWPVPSSKWWALQELADLLLHPEKGPELETHLLHELASCAFESEVLEVLTAFWMAKQRGHRVRVDVAASACPHSSLSEMLLEEIQPGGKPPVFGAAPLLAPTGYKPSEGFWRVHGVSVGQIFLSHMQRLERRTKLPFVSQFGFEWDRSLQRIAAQADDWRYFFGPRWQELTGQFFTQSSHRARSAYIRTLDVAQALWNLPAGAARNAGALALPFDPALAWLRPRVPPWLPQWPYSRKPTLQTVSQFLKTCVQQVRAFDASHHLGSISVVLPVEKLQWLEIRCVLTAHSRHGHDDSQVKVVAMARGQGLAPEVEYQFDEDGTHDPAEGPRPALVRVFSERYGVLHTDLEQHGLFVPVPPPKTGRLTGRPKDHQLELLIDEVSMACIVYWNSQWEPAHPKELSPLCGTATVLYDSGKGALGEVIATPLAYAFTAKWVKLGNSFEKAITEDWAGQIEIT